MKIEDEKKKPNFPRRLFWEYRFDAIDWDKESIGIIERVIERGTLAEWNELIGFYGSEKVVSTLKTETNYLGDETIIKVCSYFHLQPEELKCYTRKQKLVRSWI